MQWIRSFLSDRTYQLAYGGDLSHIYLLKYGVPQGSVLGPLLYVLYTAELCHVESLQSCKTVVHCPINRAWNIYKH